MRIPLIADSLKPGLIKETEITFNQLARMKIINITILIILIITLLPGCSQEKNQPDQISLIPWPKSIDIKSGTLKIGNSLILVSTPGNSEINKLFLTCKNDFSEIGFKVSRNQDQDSNNISGIKISFVLQEDKFDNYGSDGYAILIDNQISLHAGSISGLFWGTRTLLQLLKNGPGTILSRLEISDSPVYNYRGFMISVDRQFHSMDFHLRTLKKMAYYKLNYYMIHFSGRDGYSLPSDLYPSLPTPGKHYTKEEIRKLVDLAREYNITIIPSIDVPGHTGALIKAIPELNFDERQRSIHIAREETYQIIQHIFEEVMELFPGPYWHLGADEVKYPDLINSPDKAYSDWMKKYNLTKGDQLLNLFINRMYDFVKGKGYKMLVWEGFKPHLKPEVNREIIVCPFDIKFEGVMPQDYMNAGYKILNTSWTPLYIANKTSMTTPETFARWNPLMFGAGRSPQPYEYWKKFNPKEIPTEIIGAQMCIWDIEEKAEWGLLFGSDAGPGFPDYGRPAPRVQIFSERVWTGEITTAKELLERTGVAYWEY